MKKIIYLLFALLLTSCVNAQAQHHPSHEGAIHSKGFATMDKSGVLTAYEFERKTVGDNDVLIGILYSGICHSATSINLATNGVVRFFLWFPAMRLPDVS